MNGRVQHRGEVLPGLNDGRGPAVVLIGKNRMVLAASEGGMRFVQKAAVWVADTVKGKSREMKFCDALVAVLEGKIPSAKLLSPDGKHGVQTSDTVQIVPAYEGGGKSIIGALVVVDPLRAMASIGSRAA